MECFFHSEKQNHFVWVMTAHFLPYGWVLFIGWGWQFSKDFVVDELYLWQRLRKVKLGNIRKEILGLLKKIESNHCSKYLVRKKTKLKSWKLPGFPNVSSHPIITNLHDSSFVWLLEYLILTDLKWGCAWQVLGTAPSFSTSWLLISLLRTFW